MIDTPTSLYAAWFDALPEVFRAMVPTSGAAAQSPPAEHASLPFPADQVGKALQGFDGMLTQLYQGYLPLLARGDLSADPLKAMTQSITEAFNRLLETTAGPGNAVPTLQALTGLGQPWASLLNGLVPGTPGEASGTHQLQLGIERTFGGLGDAFGLGPVRQLEQACREMLAASAAKQRAQVEYLAVVAQAWSKGTTGLLKELDAMGTRGERVESLLAFIRLWAKAVDGPLHEAMQGTRGLEVTAKVIRASTQHRLQLQKAIGLASEALHVPTRADVDDAYREIQELKRELRRLKKVLPPAAQKKLLQTKEEEA